MSLRVEVSVSMKRVRGVSRGCAVSVRERDEVKDVSERAW